MIAVIILDQFTGPTPYSLSKAPLSWDAFVAAAREGVYDASSWQRARFTEVPDDFKPAMATTVYVERDGRVAIWKMKWDSS